MWREIKLGYIMWSKTLGSGKPAKDTLFSEEQRDTCCTAKS